MAHQNAIGGFVRTYEVDATSNRLRALRGGPEASDTADTAAFAYTHDAAGNTTSETSSRHFEWNHADQLAAFRTQTAGAEPYVHVQYLYDLAGRRVKKFVRTQGGRLEVTHYIDGVFEHYRGKTGPASGENNHIHVMDGMQRVALVALVRVGPARAGDAAPEVQYVLGDHLGSSNVVLDDAGALVDREEFTPYGETSFGSYAKKRYRFTGMERDEESSLANHGARCAWRSCRSSRVYTWGSVIAANLVMLARHSLG